MLMDSKEIKQKVDKNHSFRESLEYAIEGICFAIKSERNIRFQLAIMIGVLFAGFLLQVSVFEWAILMLTFALVLLMEFVNTIAEWTIDLVTNHVYHPIAKHVKDIAAGAVLLASVFAIIIGILIFLPKILNLFIQ